MDYWIDPFQQQEKYQQRENYNTDGLILENEFQG